MRLLHRPQDSILFISFKNKCNEGFFYIFSDILTTDEWISTLFRSESSLSFYGKTTFVIETNTPCTCFQDSIFYALGVINRYIYLQFFEIFLLWYQYLLILKSQSLTYFIINTKIIIIKRSVNSIDGYFILNGLQDGFFYIIFPCDGFQTRKNNWMKTHNEIQPFINSLIHNTFQSIVTNQSSCNFSI